MDDLSRTQAVPEPEINPIIFVHGYVGSASQFASRPCGFASNGYPHDRLFAYEYDTGRILQRISRISIGRLYMRFGMDLTGYS